MGRRISSEVDRMCQSFDYLLEEYNQRLSSAESERDGGGKPGASVTMWIVEAVKTAGAELSQRCSEVLDGTELLLTDANNQLGQPNGQQPYLEDAFFLGSNPID